MKLLEQINHILPADVKVANLEPIRELEYVAAINASKRWHALYSGAQFTCFTGTKVQIPTQKALQQAANCTRTGSTLTAHADVC